MLKQVFLFPLFFGNLLWLIYALNIILNGNFEPVIPPIISFIKIFVAEKVAKSVVEWCWVVVRFKKALFRLHWLMHAIC